MTLIEFSKFLPKKIFWCSALIYLFYPMCKPLSHNLFAVNYINWVPPFENISFNLVFYDD